MVSVVAVGLLSNDGGFMWLLNQVLNRSIIFYITTLNINLPYLIFCAILLYLRINRRHCASVPNVVHTSEYKNNTKITFHFCKFLDLPTKQKTPKSQFLQQHNNDADAMRHATILYENWIDWMNKISIKDRTSEWHSEWNVQVMRGGGRCRSNQPQKTQPENTCKSMVVQSRAMLSIPINFNIVSRMLKHGKYNLVIGFQTCGQTTSNM